MKKLGLDMVTCTSCSQPHQVQRKDLAAHLEAVASKVRGDRGGIDDMFAYSGSSRSRRHDPKRAQRMHGKTASSSRGRW